MASRPLNFLHAHRGYVAYIMLIGALLIGAVRQETAANRLEDRVRVDERTCENRRERNVAFTAALLAFSQHIRALEPGPNPDLASLEDLIRELPPVVC